MSLNLTQITKEAALTCPEHTISNIRGNITYTAACINTNATIETDAQCLTIRSPTTNVTNCGSLQNLVNRNKSRTCSTSCQMIRANNASSSLLPTTAAEEPTYSGFRPMFSTNPPYMLPTYTLSPSSPNSTVNLYPNFSLVILFFLFFFLLKH
ncbi:hypothetical protein BD770DRAFT_376757 [Pilaira anomala]|nr:hypothetical protein BD770DRAFT_376757 [Pilaira anomala]